MNQENIPSPNSLALRPQVKATMKGNENKEVRISWKEIQQHFNEIKSKVESITITINSISDLGKINRVFEGRKIDRWEIGVGGKKRIGHEKTMVLYFKLRTKEVDHILDWLHVEKPEITWGLWEKWGDPLVYWKSDDKRLYRYYWLGQKIGKLRSKK